MVLEQESIEFLGITLDKSGIKLQEHIIIKLRDFPDEIKDKKQLQQFLGILNYGRNFIKNVSQKEIPFKSAFNCCFYPVFIEGSTASITAF